MLGLWMRRRASATATRKGARCWRSTQRPRGKQCLGLRHHPFESLGLLREERGPIGRLQNPCVRWCWHLRYDELPLILAEKFPEFQHTYADFDEDAEIGPGILVAAFSGFLRERFRVAQMSDRDEDQVLVSRIFAFLEDAAGDENSEIPTVIQVEFMEHMWTASRDEYRAIKKQLGPKSLELLLKTESY